METQKMVASAKLCLAALAALAGPVFGDLVEADDAGFVSSHEIEIGVPPVRVFDALIDEVAEWWDPAHSYSGDAANFSFDAGSSGALALVEDLGDGGFVIHLRVVFARRPETLVLTGGLGPLQRLGVADSMSFDLEATQTGTKLSYRYTVNGRNVAPLAEPVDRVQLGQLERLKHYVETGSPVSK